MKTIIKLATAMAVASACSAASASSINVQTFETFMPGIYTNGEVLVDGAQQLTVRGQGGFDGALINGRDPNSCDLAVCPTGNQTNYYAGLNDGGFTFNFGGSAYRLASIDFGFILPLDMLVGFSVGKLVATGSDGTVVARDFALQNGAGDYTFETWNFGNSFGNLTEVTFNACLYNGAGACVNPAGNQAQFAVDNLTYVPEPGTLPLLGLSLAGMLAAFRRRKSA